MITSAELAEILTLYRRHGWEIRSILASSNFDPGLLKQAGTDLSIEMVETDAAIDAIWFSRKRGNGDVSWEIRHLTKSPFALCESFPDGTPRESIEATKKEMELRLRERASK